MKYSKLSQILGIKNQKGVIALLAIVIVSLAVLIMALNASLLGLGSLELGYISQESGEATTLADACLENTLYLLKLNPHYSGGTLNLIPGSCIIKIVENNNDREISIEANANNFFKTINANITLSGQNIILNSWKEI